MKVKIKKEGKTKQYNIISKWSEVTLENWLRLIELETGSKTNEALETITALSDIPKQLVKELGIQDVAVIMSRIAELQQEQDSKLKRIIEVEGKEYGFHPDLDSITLGEYADIETFIKNGIENNLPEDVSRASAVKPFFFYNLGSELSKILPLYLMERLNKMGKDLETKVSQKDGDGSE